MARPTPGAACVFLAARSVTVREPIAEDDDLFGTAVNEVARITVSFKGGEILVADVVRQLTKGKEFMFSDRWETALKGFEDPVRLLERCPGARAPA